MTGARLRRMQVIGVVMTLLVGIVVVLVLHAQGVGAPLIAAIVVLVTGADLLYLWYVPKLVQRAAARRSGALPGPGERERLSSRRDRRR